ncbi:uncharacterized protein K489DRAFT_406376 [Dissoconium aciculare CBS 342.82]|uniref:Uncharacterized protein n=1 Tax=Dissoconium aciculare CBS 342.82 TaxID=1314786 RepID=A0A6J3MII8_9PEZI|nr:uncharacterized protein K489DRAFT_406376 [Dissoconium aciculare CBS 342.82]KAF1827718.1 hypothetical protein K489DRAFT_406376 [Dissoconium aciculare CBS 342.82]
MSGNAVPSTPRKTAADVAFESIEVNPAVASDSNGPAIRRSSTGERRGSKTRLIGSSPVTDGLQHSLGTIARRVKKSGGSILQAAVTNGRTRSPEKKGVDGKPTHANGQPLAQRKTPTSRPVAEMTPRSSPAPRDASCDTPSQSESERSREEQQQQQQQPPLALDPAQLVQMALSLSESRARITSLPLRAPASQHVGNRIVSIGSDFGYNTIRTPQRNSRLGDNSSPHSLSSRGYGSENLGWVDTSMAQGEENTCTFTPATLSRAEKARKYFELASEHRRLLEHLPPLRPDGTISNARNGHHTDPHDQTGKLGRAYNPLQALRNRRLRNRERRLLAAPPETWQETDRIRKWIDDLAANSNNSQYGSDGHSLRLPQYEGEMPVDRPASESRPPHRRTNTNQSVITRTANAWSIDPAELLADTYWLETKDNRSIIEDRHGRRIFTARSQADSPRVSKEHERHGNGRTEELLDSENDSRGHPRRRLLHLPDRLRRPHISHTASTTSTSSPEGRQPPELLFENVEEGGDENIGPLERHMREMIDKDARGELPSPEPISPDHWDSQHTHFPLKRHRSGSGGARQNARNRLVIDTHARLAKGDRSGLASPDHGLSSMDEMVSDSPISPTMPAFAHPASINSSLPGSKHASRSELRPVTSTTPSAPPQGIEKAMTAPAKPAIVVEAAMPSDSGDTSQDAVYDQGRPGSAPQRPIHRRHRTADSIVTGGLRRLGSSKSNVDDLSHGAIKENGDPNGRRLFKNNRISAMVRNESTRLGDRLRGQREQTPASDVSEAGNDSPLSRPVALETEISPRTSLDQGQSRSRYYLPSLNSFKSPVAGKERRRAGTYSSPESDATGRQQKAMRNPERTSPGDRLIPQRAPMPAVNTAASKSGPQSRKTVSLLSPTSAQTTSAGSLSSTSSIADFRSGSIDSTASTSQGRRRTNTTDFADAAKRHWSISDQHKALSSLSPTASHLAARDIARVRALLLASGIKAREILRQADSIRISPSPTASKPSPTNPTSSSTTTTQNPCTSWLAGVPRRSEPLAAARHLSSNLTADLASLESSMHTFRTTRTDALAARLSALQERAASHLAARVHGACDGADHLVFALTTQQPQDLKRADDAMDQMLRQRRRQFRWLRRAGFKGLEWMLLSLMWWAWFVVLIVNSIRRIVVGGGRAVKWLVWF